MSYTKAIEHGKSHRKPYRGAKAVDPTCRNHGSDLWSESNRLHARRKAETAAEYQMREYNTGRLEDIPITCCAAPPAATLSQDITAPAPDR